MASFPARLSRELRTIVQGMNCERTLRQAGVPKKIKSIFEEEVQILRGHLEQDLPKVPAALTSRWVLTNTDKVFINRICSRTITATRNPVLRYTVITALASGMRLYPAAVLDYAWRNNPDNAPNQLVYTPPTQNTAKPCKLTLYRSLMRIVVSSEEAGLTLQAAFVLDLIPDDIYDRYQKTRIRSGGFYSERPETIAADRLVLKMLLNIRRNMNMRDMAIYAGWTTQYLYKLLRLHDVPLDAGTSTEIITSIREAFHSHTTQTWTLLR